MKKVASVAGTVPPGPFSVAELRQESPSDGSDFFHMRYSLSTVYPMIWDQLARKYSMKSL